ncbi:MAG TPA: glycosyltransferase family 2 protein [Thermoanaerobaculia bacterium]|nr:glycosyltransferase family 2 protein [Thermoanaerobaculia bacterium]
MKLSIVATLYESAATVREFVARSRAAAAALTDDFEIILVNDGSPDSSLDEALALFEHDPCLRIVDLSRNFGHHLAMMTGLAHARGDLVFLLDSDLEEDPALLADFHRELLASDADVVFGVQSRRKGGVLERVSGSLFYSIFNRVSSVKVPRNVVTARLMTRRYVDALVTHRDREVFLLGLWTITGFRQVPVAIEKKDKGRTTYGVGRKAAVLVNSLTSFSNRPLILIFWAGCLILGCATIAAVDLVVRRLFFGTLLQGWPSLIVSIWLLGGFTIFCLGVIGIYVAKIFTEVKERPYTVVRRVYEHAPPGRP